VSGAEGSRGGVGERGSMGDQGPQGFTGIQGQKGMSVSLDYHMHVCSSVSSEQSSDKFLSFRTIWFKLLRLMKH
jgi:hypothetical protein